MAAGLAHEIDQPLSAIVAYASGSARRIRDGDIGVPALLEVVDSIADEALRAGEILRRIRDFVRHGEVSRSRADLNALVREAVHFAEVEARELGIALRLALAPEPLAVEVDGIQVEQVILNLLRNGLDAMSEAPTGQHELLVQTRGQSESTVEVSVRDTGVGMSPATGERIFDPFFTTKVGGLGMGLSISRSIIEAHGGRLWATRNPDRGMTFSFTLPVRQRDEIRAA